MYNLIIFQGGQLYKTFDLYNCSCNYNRTLSNKNINEKYYSNDFVKFVKTFSISPWFLFFS